MLFSIPFIVVFSSLCLLTKQTEIKESDAEISLGHNIEQGGYVEEPILNSQSKEIYKECLKNHASSIGGYALDGCCEFLPAGIKGTSEFFRCAACGCHKNFHRKVTIAREPTHFLFKTTYSPQPTPISIVPQTTNGYRHATGPSSGSTTSLAFPSTIIHDGVVEGSSSSKKRFRTKFTPEQKENMLNFAVKIGWRIQKHDQEVVEHFCNKIGVKYHVFKVWMLNNRNTVGKKH
ncbi:zinc-finger homeodomain protein 2-like [Trifolium pratense]|uniref:zinc-finger homeodomain protein 2-like n=1 Tax=Trifolium pratense TaxID=57577 RepID=UPI001E69270D|nr:zinc-finger homeodomain protein 2-like [Trifolium pratense]